MTQYYTDRLNIIFNLSGSLGTAVLQPELSMVGASAGVYALLLAHLPNVIYVSSFLSCPLIILFLEIRDSFDDDHHHIVF